MLFSLPLCHTWMYSCTLLFMISLYNVLREITQDYRAGREAEGCGQQWVGVRGVVSKAMRQGRMAGPGVVSMYNYRHMHILYYVHNTCTLHHMHMYSTGGDQCSCSYTNTCICTWCWSMFGWISTKQPSAIRKEWEAFYVYSCVQRKGQAAAAVQLQCMILATSAQLSSCHLILHAVSH